MVWVEACDQGHNFPRWQLLNTVIPCSPLSSKTLIPVSLTARRVCFQALKTLAVILARTTLKEWMEQIVIRTAIERRKPLRCRYRWVNVEPP